MEKLFGRSSVWNYAWNLSNKINECDEFECVILYCNKGGQEREVREVDLKIIKYNSDDPDWHNRTVDHDIDIYHLYDNSYRHILPAFLTDRPVVATSHGSWNLRWKKYVPKDHFPSHELHPHSRSELKCISLRWAERVSKYAFDKVYPVSDWVTEALISKAGFKNTQVSTLYEAIDDAYFQYSSQYSDEFPSDYILHVSYAQPRKNVRTILLSLKKLEQQNIFIPLIIAGSSWESELRPVVNRLGLSDQVTFVGYVDKKRLIKLYDNATCFVYPSFVETFGLPNIEAMARGTPVITTNRGAIPEIVSECAILIDDPGDYNDLANQICRIVFNQNLTSKLMKNGRRRSYKFSWDSHFQDLKREYKDIFAQYD